MGRQSLREALGRHGKGSGAPPDLAGSGAVPISRGRLTLCPSWGLCMELDRAGRDSWLEFL